jgi:hypothetical protein
VWPEQRWKGAECRQIWEADQLTREDVSGLRRKKQMGQATAAGSAVPTTADAADLGTHSGRCRAMESILLTFVLETIFNGLAALSPADEATRMAKCLRREEALTIPGCFTISRAVAVHANTVADRVVHVAEVPDLAERLLAESGATEELDGLVSRQDIVALARLSE